MPFPAGSLSVTFYLSLPSGVVAIVNGTVNAALVANLTSDIAFNLALLLNVSEAQLLRFVLVTAFDGVIIATSAASRRLLAGQADVNVTFVLLGSIAQSSLAIDPQAAVAHFASAAANGTLQAPSTGATIPAQQVIVASANPAVPWSSSSSGFGALPPSSSPSSDSLSIALGVGLGVGIPVLVAAAALLWHFGCKRAAPVQQASAMLHQRLPAGSASQ